MARTDELLSVIVPVYNVEEYLADCIESLIHQTYDQLELILVDDGSTDKGGLICDKYQNKDDRVKVIHKSNGGLVSARKAGMKAARGKYISFVDSDDWLELTMYEELMGPMLSEDLDMISSGEIREYAGGSYIYHDKLKPGIYEGDGLHRHVLKQFISTDNFFEMNISMKVTNKIFKYNQLFKCIEEIPNEISIGEDAACICPFVFQARKIAISEKAYYHYRLRGDSIMGRAGAEDKDKIGKLSSYLLNIPLNLTKEMREQYEVQIKFLAMFFMLLSDILDCKDKQNNQFFWLFPDIPTGSRVILCGAGRFGARLHEYIAENRIYEVVLWVDQKAEDGKISAYDAINNEDYDYIIVSALKADVIRDIKKRLSDLVMKQECIKSVEAETIKEIDFVI